MSVTGVKDVRAEDFIRAFAAHLKKSGKLELPNWHDLVKTGVHKEMPPQNPDWYFVRAASLARKIYIRGGTGVGAFSKVYGGRNRKSKGTGRFHFSESATGLNRHILQKLEEQNLISKKEDAPGRWITAQGQKELDTIAKQIVKVAAAQQ